MGGKGDTRCSRGWWRKKCTGVGDKESDPSGYLRDRRTFGAAGGRPVEEGGGPAMREGGTG